MALAGLYLSASVPALAGGPPLIRYMQAPQPLLPRRTHASPVMMPSPLRIRERAKKLGAAARGVVVGTQNVLISKTPYSRLVGVRFKPSYDDDDDESPAVLSDEICLVPGSPVAASGGGSGNARRIFTGIDIVVETNDVLELVWETLTDYPNLADGIPNLVDNKVLERRPDAPGWSRLVVQLAPGVVFKATTTLDVKEHEGAAGGDGGGSPAGRRRKLRRRGQQEGHGQQGAAQVWRGAATDARCLPRPYLISALPYRDITMQGVPGLGDFSFYQGVWRFQSLPGCAPRGSSAMRLTYSVELSPKLRVPVALLEGNIAKALGENLEAIRDFVTRKAESAKAV